MSSYKPKPCLCGRMPLVRRRSPVCVSCESLHRSLYLPARIALLDALITRLRSAVLGPCIECGERPRVGGKQHRCRACKLNHERKLLADRQRAYRARVKERKAAQRADELFAELIGRVAA